MHDYIHLHPVFPYKCCKYMFMVDFTQMYSTILLYKLLRT